MSRMGYLDILRGHSMELLVARPISWPVFLGLVCVLLACVVEELLSASVATRFVSLLHLTWHSSQQVFL